MSASTFARSTYNRAVHLRITPRPSNIGESREILRLISQFGHVEHFRNLKYDALSAPNAAIVIFKEEEAATACLKRSPIRFRLGPATEEEAEKRQHEAPKPTVRSSEFAASASQQFQDKGPSGSPFGMGNTQTRALSTLPIPRRKEPPMPFLGSQESPSQPLSRIFQIQTNPARKQFRDGIDLAEYHGSFALDTRSVIQQDLARRVPIDGLSCWNWRKEGKPWRVIDRAKRSEREQGPTRRKSLKELYDEGKAAGGSLSSGGVLDGATWLAGT